VPEGEPRPVTVLHEVICIQRLKKNIRETAPGLTETPGCMIKNQNSPENAPFKKDMYIRFPQVLSITKG
jgi:hypothetical protein